MLHHVATLVLAVDDNEPDKAAFYILGGLLAVWAVVLGFIGVRSETFPATSRASTPSWAPPGCSSFWRSGRP
jgi:hypothetical protein